MNKIKFDLEEQKNKIVKFGKYKLEIRPYLLTPEKTIISDMCCQQIKSEIGKDKNGSFHTARLVFDIIVTALCSNVAIDGVEIKYKKNKFSSVSLDLKEKDLESFEKSGIAFVVESNIDNCAQIWNDVVKDIELNANNFAEMFEKFKDIIPSGEKQEKIVEEIKTIVDDFNKKNPQIAKEVPEKPFREMAKQDTIKVKNQTKQEKLNNKK